MKTKGMLRPLLFLGVLIATIGLGALTGGCPGLTLLNDHDNTPSEATLLELTDRDPALRALGYSDAFMTSSIERGGDRDYYCFLASAGCTYEIIVGASHDRIDSYLTLYGADGTTVLAEDDNGLLGGPLSKLVWTAQSSGRLYAKVQHVDPAGTGSYEIHVNEDCDASTNDSTGESEDELGDDACIRFDLIDATAFAPSVVKLYFQLTYCDGTPASSVGADEFIITEDGAEVSVFESSQDYSPEPRPFGLTTVLLLDMSGSILDSGNLPSLQSAARTFVSQVANSHPVAIYTFDGRAHLQLLTEATTDTAALQGDIDGLSAYEVVDESTNLNGAVVEGLDKVDDALTRLAGDAVKIGTLVVFTDGTDQAARVSNTTAVAAVRASSHSVYAIGLGGEVDSDHLANIGKSGVFVANDVAALQTAFSNVAQAIQARANSYYVLAYCSPKRAGQHTVTLSLRGASGAVSYSFNAAGFSGGCSAADFVGSDE